MTPHRLLAAFALVVALLDPTSRARADAPLDDEIARLDEAIARHPADVSLLVARAEHLVLAGRADAAMPDLALASALAPADPRIGTVRAEALVSLDQEDAALAELDRVLGSGLSSARVLQLRARVLASLHRTAEAIAAWDEALASAADPDGFLERAALLASEGRDDEALAGLRDGLEHTGAASLRAAVIERARRTGHPEVALEAIEPLVREVAPHWLVVRGEILLEAGREAEARRDLEAALAALTARLARRPTAALHVDQARALLALGRLDEAEAAALRALSRSARYQPAIDTRAEVRARRRGVSLRTSGGAR